MKRVMLAAVLTLGASAAGAQQTFSEVQRAIAQQAEQQVRVNVVMNMFVPAPAGDQALAAQERARRQMYGLAMKECAILQEVIAKDCRIEAVNVNVNRHQGQQQVEGFTIGANMNFRVTLK